MLVFSEVKRVLKKTGTFWLNMGDCFASNGTEESRFYHGENPGKHKMSNDNFSGRTRMNDYPAKCMLMQPERMAIRLIDELGFILRNKIKWCKQVYLFKDKITKGSVMPTSVKDRFNESGEELYFFVKSKKYYFDLDAVRLKVQTDLHPRPFGKSGNLDRQDTGRIYNDFNYRVRDAELKAEQSQFKATEEEIKKYKGKRKSLEARMDDTKNKDTKSSRTYNMKKLLSEVRLGIKPNTGMEKINGFVPYEQAIGKSWHNHKSDMEKGAGQKDVRACYPLGKNLPTCWLIGTEPHNFQREFGVDTDHFATFPQALCEIPIKAGCPKGGVVMDIFSGSGTTCLVAKKLGRKFIGIDLNKEYNDIAVNRIKAVPQSLF